jgi:phosphoribosylamine---glycine ligase
MKVLVVGSGGREHALCWKIAASSEVSEVICAPGNAGTAAVARNVPVGPGTDKKDLEALVRLAREESVGLVVIGPEAPLCAGLADRMRAAGLTVFGPGAAGARIEGSKAFAKELLERHKIPTAAWRQFDRSGTAKSYLETCKVWPQVVKADGLAGGKGVLVCHDTREAFAAVDAILEEKRLGEAGGRVVIEEFLHGEEASVLAVTDGQAILILEPVMDHKQVGDGDTGPNTGGMGVVSPVSALTRRLQRQIEQRVLVPTVHALKREEIEFRGVLYVGLMMTESGPKVLEFNARFGDPEAQVLVRRFQSDLVPYLVATAEGRLSDMDPPDWDPRTCVGVVCAAAGYPASYAKGDVVEGLEAADRLPEVVTFHAGTKVEDGRVLTDGGRVVCVTAMGADLDEARGRAYRGVDAIEWNGKFCRRDIGAREVARRELAAAALDRVGPTPPGPATRLSRG